MPAARAARDLAPLRRGDTLTGADVSALRAHRKLAIGIAGVSAVAAAALILSLTVWDSSGSGDSEAAAGDAEQALLDFARCMRDNGVPSFPDPVAKLDGGFRLERPPGVSPSALDDALGSCRSEAQAAGIDAGSAAPDTDAQDRLLELSRCMRANGIPEFPDPQPGSDVLTGLHGLFQNFDLESPRVARALQRCQSVVNQLLAPVHGGGS
jgi:hypothetical protein